MADRRCTGTVRCASRSHHALPHRRQPLLALALHERADFVARILDATLRLAVAAVELRRRAQRVGERGRGRPATSTSSAASTTSRTRTRSATSSPSARTTRPRSATASRPRATTPAPCAPRSPSRCGTRSTAPGSRLRSAGPRDMSREEFARFVEWVKGVSLAFDGSAYRTMLRNDAFWFTRLGTRHRARRQHRPHPRREVPRAPAGDRAGRRLARLFPVDHDPARGLGAHRLSLGLPRERQALARRRPSDPQPADAALARQLLRDPRPAPRPRSPTPTAAAARASGWRATSWPGSRAPASKACSSRACTSSSQDFIAENNRLGAAIAEQYLT